MGGDFLLRFFGSLRVGFCLLLCPLVQILLVFGVKVQALLCAFFLQFPDPDFFGFFLLRFDLTALQLIGGDVFNPQLGTRSDLALLQLPGNLGQILLNFEYKTNY